MTSSLPALPGRHADDAETEPAFARTISTPAQHACTELILAPEQHPLFVYLGRLSPASRRPVRRWLDVIARLLTDDGADAVSFPWHHIRYAHTAAVRSVLAERYAIASANAALSAFRGVLKECWRLGLTAADDYQRAVDIQVIRGSTVPAGRALSGGELQALFQACSDDHRPAGLRDAALFAVCFGAGLRRAEAVGLDSSCFHAETGEIRVLKGKGRKARTTYVSGGGRAAIRAWLHLRGRWEGPMFLPISKSGRITRRPLTEQAVYQIVKTRALRAGIEPLSPHDLRRTFFSALLDAGADISAVQQLGGHASIQTTLRYDRRGERVKQSAAELLHVPLDR